MKKSVFLGTAAAATLLAGMGMAQEGSTLAQVKERGELNCGVNTGLVGFAAPDASGNWTGFDVAFCRALAAAVLGDPAKVTRGALENAASIAAMILTTEALITDLPEKNPPAPAAPPMDY